MGQRLTSPFEPDYLDDIYEEFGVGDNIRQPGNSGKDELAAVAADFAAEVKKLTDERKQTYDIEEGIDGRRSARGRRPRLAFERSVLDTIAEEQTDEECSVEVLGDRNENNMAQLLRNESSTSQLAHTITKKMAKVIPGTIVCQDLKVPENSGEKLEKISAMFCVETSEQAAQRRRRKLGAKKDKMTTDVSRHETSSQSQKRKKSVKRRLIGWFRSARRFLLCQGRED